VLADDAGLVLSLTQVDGAMLVTVGYEQNVNGPFWLIQVRRKCS